MMMLFNLIFAACLGYYLRFVWGNWRALSHTPQAANHVTGNPPSVSIIIPARNESAHVSQCLSAVLAQQYPDFEVILVDDHSTDDTLALAQGVNDEKLRVLQAPPSAGPAYKKAAITHGITHAKGDIIVQTDADCYMGPHWIQTLAAQFQPEVAFVSGPVRLTHDGSLFQRLQSLEYMGLISLGLGSILRGQPNMANGANMAYRKTAFAEVEGFRGIDHIASGDDELLLQKLHATGLGLAVAYDTDAIVETSASPTWAAFKAQRLRWVSKARAYKNRKVNVVQFISFLGFCAFPFWLLSGQWDWLLGGFLLKMTVDALLMFQASQFFRSFNLFKLLPILEPIYIVYVLWVGIAGNVGKSYTWKSREVV